VNAISIDQRVEAVRTQERDGGREAHHILLLVVVELLAILGADQASQDDGRAPIETRMIADLLQGCHDLDVLEKAFGYLFALGIALEILQAQNLSLAGQRELRIEGRQLISLPSSTPASSISLVSRLSKRR